MTDSQKNYSVFNPGAPQAASITITFSSVKDAAWFERSVLEVKMGNCAPLMMGILRDSVRSVSTLEAFDLRGAEPVTLTPDQLKEIRCL